MDKWAGKWNAWADSSALEPYSAWTLTPFYFGSEEDFDFIWLGVSPDAKALGRAYDKYLSQYRTAHGSEAGMWVMWPAYGGGDAEFDFKFVVSHPNYESLGVDYDQYSGGGYAKAQELFGEVIDCDTARAYNALQRRDGIPDE